ncbi:metallophosphoesterase [Pleionea sp. CnH1-48]|uniref:metallophosphoesterase n=1 Tax=Pleionea sp. CnH1-48 TaxID=2954494 RepID=UPI002097AF65|nr:metallophosphoesterase [Pleionea sp. CnH1-48]MCO7224219.1 metallophosphoesterase [Pleionea sp. CnH1-48]
MALYPNLKKRPYFWSLFFISAFLGLWAFWWEPASLTQQSYTIEIKNWPKSCDGIKVAVIADLHIGSAYNSLTRLDEVIEHTHTSQPDLILLAGDFMNHSVVSSEQVAPDLIAQRLSALKAPMGVYAVMGNHDWWYGAEQVKQGFLKHNMHLLEDDAVLLEQNECQFWLSGISDFWEGPHDIALALAKVPEDAVNIVVTHNPDIFDHLPASVELTIAGHTHGGQVHLPFIGRPAIPSQFGERFAAGHIEEQGKHLFVNTGVGTSILPVRFRVPPEISLVSIKRTAH